jgi:hypothetical protein
MLPGPRLFRSRWTAILWAGGILWLAIDVAGVGGGAKQPAPGVTNDVTGVPVDDSETRKALNAFDLVS